MKKKIEKTQVVIQNYQKVHNLRLIYKGMSLAYAVP